MKTPQQTAQEIEQFYKNTFSCNRTMANLMAQNDIQVRIKTLIEAERDLLPKDTETFLKWQEKVMYYNNLTKELQKLYYDQTRD